MEVKDLFDPAVKREIIERINKLTPDSQRQWGKMDAAQMMAHCQVPMGVALGTHKLKRNFILGLIGPFFKKKLYGPEPFKRSLPTDKSFVMADKKDFEKEKQALTQMVNSFTAENMVDEKHPFFGRLTKEQWSKGTWKHLDHHLQQFGV
jgi:hypothetical protein